MPTADIRFTARAASELGAAFRWYRQRNAVAAEKLLSEVAATVGRIASSPGSHRSVRHNVRRAFVRRFPYAVYFESTDASIVILGIVHLRRSSAEWPPGTN
ncbi:type II toxin-antitoxin system RelE/ParE family toxin [Pseudogemmatithrix spongiicola]|uniref:type II toxin-antitoxin system RelE/ParE family toxin n=1 Tax=Pseudogemmatithrix spongiicola TaxID=3062599 RepID=UPI0034659D28